MIRAREAIAELRMAVMNNVRLRGDDWQDDENLAATQEGVAVPVGWASQGSWTVRHGRLATYWGKSDGPMSDVGA